MPRLLKSPFRETLSDLAGRARESLLIACPFIQSAEMEMICGRVKVSAVSPPQVRVLTQLRSGSVLDGSLQIGALVEAQRSLGPSCTIVHLPRLHAKLYVADLAAAIVTSANLTKSGLDLNYEYGVLLTETELIAQLREDIESFSAVGSQIAPSDLQALENAGEELCREYEHTQRTVSGNAKRKFDRIVRRTDYKFLGTLVGPRTKNALFSEAISYVLRYGPLSTEGIHRRVKDLLPDLCDDSRELIIRGERFGKAWKHDVRNAQQALKRHGRIAFSAGKWQLVN